MSGSDKRKPRRPNLLRWGQRQPLLGDDDDTDHTDFDKGSASAFVLVLVLIGLGVLLMFALVKWT